MMFAIDRIIRKSRNNNNNENKQSKNNLIILIFGAKLKRIFLVKA